MNIGKGFPIIIYKTLKTTSKERIRLALDRSGKSITDLAKKLNRAQPSVSERLSGEGDVDSVKLLDAASAVTGYSFEWLRTGKGPELVSPDLEGNQVSYEALQYFHEQTGGLPKNIKTEEKLEMLVASQQRTIQLLEEKIKRLEQEIEAGKNKVNK